jgi:hypothetical protein
VTVEVFGLERRGFGIEGAEDGPASGEGARAF